MKSKGMIVVYIVVAIVLILLLVGRKSVHTETTINASPQEVWTVLTDVSKVKEWNSVLIPIEGELKVGEKVNYEFRQDENSSTQMPATVKQIVPNQLLNQKGGMTAILTFDHRYILEETNEGTKVTIHEEYRGVMVPFWNPKPVEEAYTKLLDQLNERVKALKKNELNS